MTCFVVPSLRSEVVPMRFRLRTKGFLIAFTGSLRNDALSSVPRYCTVTALLLQCNSVVIALVLRCNSVHKALLKRRCIFNAYLTQFDSVPAGISQSGSPRLFLSETIAVFLLQTLPLK